MQSGFGEVEDAADNESFGVVHAENRGDPDTLGCNEIVANKETVKMTRTM